MKSKNNRKKLINVSKNKFYYVAWNLIVIKDIQVDEELTVKYEWYKPTAEVARAD